MRISIPGQASSKRRLTSSVWTIANFEFLVPSTKIGLLALVDGEAVQWSMSSGAVGIECARWTETWAIGKGEMGTTATVLKGRFRACVSGGV